MNKAKLTFSAGKTYDEWRDEGFQVRRGCKATGRNEKGIATFRRDQVDRAQNEPGDCDYELDQDFADFDPLDFT